jgi:hypothetical protein
VKRPRTLLISCGALAREITELIRRNGWEHMTVQCLPAGYHMTPEKIPEGVRAKIRAGRDKFDRVLVLFADCGTGGALDQMLEEEGVERIGGNHCCEFYAGGKTYSELVEAEPGSFFLTDFLARHFDRLVIEGLGLDRYPQLLEDYFKNYRKLVYLAQVRDPELERKARAAAERLNLSFECRYTGYGDLGRLLAAAGEATIE